MPVLSALPHSCTVRIRPQPNPLYTRMPSGGISLCQQLRCWRRAEEDSTAQNRKPTIQQIFDARAPPKIFGYLNANQLTRRTKGGASGGLHRGQAREHREREAGHHSCLLFLLVVLWVRDMHKERGAARGTLRVRFLFRCGRASARYPFWELSCAVLSYPHRPLNSCGASWRERNMCPNGRRVARARSCMHALPACLFIYASETQKRKTCVILFVRDMFRRSCAVQHASTACCLASLR